VVKPFIDCHQSKAELWAITVRSEGCSGNPVVCGVCALRAKYYQEETLFICEDGYILIHGHLVLECFSGKSNK